MSEKSDDIKQLFSHLGLNPSDYQEIRSAPSSGATMTEAPRRWSLLQAINTQAPAARVAPTLAPATPAVAPAPAAVPPPPTPSQWAEILPGLSVPRGEPATTAVPVPPSPPPAAAVEPPPAPTVAVDGLSSLFQSVRESPVPPPVPAAAPEPALTGEQAADRLYRELRSSAQTLAGRPPPTPVTPPWAGYDPEQETRHAPIPAPPVRVAPPPPPVQAPVQPPAASAPPPRMVLPIASSDPLPVIARTPAAPPPPRPYAPPPTPAAAVAPRPVPPPAPKVETPASSGLQAAFRRLSEPEPPRAAASGRLRLNYRLAQPSSGAGNKDERLGDVLKRISGHNVESR